MNYPQVVVPQATEYKNVLSPIVITLLCGMALLAFVCIRRIPHGKVYTLHGRGGRVRTLGAGVHLVLPVLERVAHKINLSGASVAVEALQRDGSSYQAVVYYQVVDPRLAEQVIDEVDGVLRVATRRLFDFAFLPDDLDGRRRWLKQSLNAELRGRGLLVARVDLAAA